MGRFKMTRPASEREVVEMELESYGPVAVPLHPAWMIQSVEPVEPEEELLEPGEMITQPVRVVSARQDRFLTVSDILPPEAIALFKSDDEDGPTSADIEASRTGRPKPELPTRPYDQLLWRAYIRGAEWGADGEYPDWDDMTFYGDQAHGLGMLADFYDLLKEMRPKQVVANTLCSLGRPLRDHAARCHPECEWRAP